MSNKIEAVLFDLDGVLIDAKDWHYEALNRALGLFGTEIPRHDHLVTYDGLPTKKKLDMLSRERYLPTALHDFLNELKQRFTLELVATKCRPTFAHQYLLTRLRDMGLQLAVCSNSVRATVDTMLRRAAIEDFFAFSLSNQDVEKGKPDPEIYLTAMARLGLTGPQCLIVEDNSHGIAAARSAGGHVLEVGSVDDVNLANVVEAIKRFEAL